jgi:hypothetical protein
MKTLPILKSFFLLVIVAAGLSLGARSQSITGDWYSLAEVQGMSLRLNLHISGDNGALTGTFDSPEQGALAIPLTSVTLKGQTFEFAFVPAGLTYSGMVDPGYTFIMGSFKQGNLDVKLTFLRTPVEMPENSPSKIKEKYDKQEVYIEMRDGVKLFTSSIPPRMQPHRLL